MHTFYNRNEDIAKLNQEPEPEGESIFPQQLTVKRV